MWLPGGGGSEKADITMLRKSIRSNMSLRGELHSEFGGVGEHVRQDLLHPIFPMEFELIACRIRLYVPLFLGNCDIRHRRGLAV